MISAFRWVSTASEAESATAEMLSTVVEALPRGASLDLIVETLAVHQALGSCADIVSHSWDMNLYCQHEGWQRVMTSWKDQEIQGTIREFQEEGADSENVPLPGLALREAIQAVSDGVSQRDPPEGCSWGARRRETAPIEQGRNGGEQER
jgi:hypothetical protein